MSKQPTGQYASAAGVALLAFDQVLTWDMEVQCIWRGSGWTIKAMFFLARYCAMLSQIFSLTYIQSYAVKKASMDCRTWFAFQTGTVGLMFLDFQVTLMLRIYALYNRSFKIGIFLVSWFIFTLGVNFFVGRKFVQALKLDSNCAVIETPGAITTCYSALVLLDQLVLWGLTGYKYWEAFRQGWSRNPIVRLVMRDNSLTFLVIFCLFTAMVPYSIFVEQINHFAHAILCSSIAIMTCRMILNMRSLTSPEHHPDVTIEVELTTLS